LIDFYQFNLGLTFFELEDFLKKKLHKKVDLVPKTELSAKFKASINKQITYI